MTRRRARVGGQPTGGARAGGAAAAGGSDAPSPSQSPSRALRIGRLFVRKAAAAAAERVHNPLEQVWCPARAEEVCAPPFFTLAIARAAAALAARPQRAPDGRRVRLRARARSAHYAAPEDATAIDQARVLDRQHNVRDSPPPRGRARPTARGTWLRCVQGLPRRAPGVRVASARPAAAGFQANADVRVHCYCGAACGQVYRGVRRGGR